MHTLLEHTRDIAVFLLVSATCCCAGSALCRAAGLRFAGAIESFVFSAGVGSGAVALSVLGLGLAGQLRIAPVALLFSAILVACWREAARAYAQAAYIARRLRGGEGRLVAAAFAFLTLLLAARAFSPPLAFDDVIYHLTVPKLFVEQGQVFALADTSTGNLPFLVNMLYAACLLFGSEIAAKLVGVLLAASCALALYGFCTRFLSRDVGEVAMIAFFCAGMVIEVAASARVDVSLAFFLFLSTYALIVHLDTDARRWLWLSATLAGLSLGVKYSAGLWLVFAGVMYVFESLRRGRGFAATLRLGLLFVAISVAVASPWYVKNYLWFGNPVYPMFTGEVADYSADGPRYFTPRDENRMEAHFAHVMRDEPALVEQRLRVARELAARRPERHPLRFWEYFTEPKKYLMAEMFHYPNYLFLLCPLAFLCERRGWVTWLMLLSAGFFVASASLSWIARHLLPIYPPLTVVAAYGLVMTAARYRWLRMFRTVALIAAVASTCALVINRIHAYGIGDYIRGEIARADFPSRVFESHNATRYINTHLPADALVLMMGVQDVYYLERAYVPDELWDTAEWRKLLSASDSFEAILEGMKARGVTHVLYSPRLFQFQALMGVEGSGAYAHMIPNAGGGRAQSMGVDDGVYAALRNEVTFEYFRTRYLNEIYSDDYRYRLYEVR